MIQFPQDAPATPDVRVLSPWDMRRLFNEGHFLRLIRADVYTPVTRRLKPLADDSDYICRETPRGSITHILSFRDANNDTVMTIHRYFRPDGKIGGTGRRNELFDAFYY